MMYFSKQEKQKVSELLEEGKRMQIKNNNKRYTQEEMENFLNDLIIGEKEYIQDRVR